jgi:hypothetical protein
MAKNDHFQTSFKKEKWKREVFSYFKKAKFGRSQLHWIAFRRKTTKMGLGALVSEKQRKRASVLVKN